MKSIYLKAAAIISAAHVCGSCFANTQADSLYIDTTSIAEASTLQWQPFLLDPFEWSDGSGRSTDPADWPKRRQEIIGTLEHYEIGSLPQVPRDSIEAWMDGDTLHVRVHNNASLELTAQITYPDGTGPFPAIIGVGWPSGSLPAEIFSRRGIAMIAYDFNQVMSHTQKRGNEPINTLYPDNIQVGAYRAWPWGISRLIDGLEIVQATARIDTEHLGVTGCSFAGKMALFAGALDDRIALTIAQEPGGGGAAAWRVSETLGNVETLGRTNYSWFLEDMRQFSDCVDRLPIDHHQLVALIAPRALLVLGNTDYEWLADESGYVSCRTAKRVWETFGIGDHIGISIEGQHPHCQLPEIQQPHVEAFVERFLLGRDVDTNVMHAPMFDHVDWQKWSRW